MHCWAIIAAAGSGSRLAEAGLDRPKQFLEWEGAPLFWHSARTFSRVPGIRGILFVLPESELETTKAQVEEHTRQERFPIPYAFAIGGTERQDSIRNALAALPFTCDAVLIHDAARPFMSAKLAAAVLGALREGHKAVTPGILLADTIKEVDAQGKVQRTLVRSNLRAIQTPQGFSLPELVQAHADALRHDVRVTDDAALMEQNGLSVLVIPGEEGNRKITTPEDLAMLYNKPQQMSPYAIRTGFGYDVHAYGGPRPLILGGVPVPSEYTVSAHSDGDVLLHALTDAILGCLGRGDIGDLFPDSDAKYDGIESGILLSEVMRLAQQDGFQIQHVDLTVVAQVPKLSPYKDHIAANVAKLLALPANVVNLKATTEEKLGFTGEKKGIKAYAIVTGIMLPKSLMLRP